MDKQTFGNWIMLEPFEFYELFFFEGSFSYKHGGKVFMMEESQKEQVVALYEKVIKMCQEENKSEFSLIYEGCRYRAFATDSVTGLKVIVRKMEINEQSWDSLGFPKHYLENLSCSFESADKKLKCGGLIIICGQPHTNIAVSGYALINDILRNMPWACTTIEAKVEALLSEQYPSGACVIQRELRCSEIAPALMSALRSDQDLIMVGDGFDTEGARLILDAARLGHLVIATLYAHNIVEAIKYFISLAIDAELTRSVFAEVFRGCIWHESVRCKSEISLTIASEALFADESVKVRLRSGEISKLQMNINRQKVAEIEGMA